MIFTDPLFLLGFMPLYFVGFWTLPLRLRKWFLLGASVVVYAWGEPRFLPWILSSALMDWFLAGWMDRSSRGTTRSLLLTVAVLGNVGLLIHFKYASFLSGVFAALNQSGSAPVEVMKLVPPLALSFMFFEKITYVVDVYRRLVVPASSFLDYLMFVFFFPKMIAGPIIKYHDINWQFRGDNLGFRQGYTGMVRVCCGLAKKVLMADTLGSVVDPVFAGDLSRLSCGMAWFGAFAFALQIYFDFSGYSDMALGLAQMMGITLPENFRQPYLSVSITEFWQRWHISLSSWIREYLYIPLGGNRFGFSRTILNLWLCFLICGLWHGANWTFLAWGAAHGCLLTVERWLSGHWRSCLHPIARVAWTFTAVTLTWVLFRSESMDRAEQYYQAMFSPGRPSYFVADVNPYLFFIFCLGILLSFWTLLPFGLVEKGRRLVALWIFPWQGLGWAVLLVLCLGNIAAVGVKTFLYFRF